MSPTVLASGLLTLLLTTPTAQAGATITVHSLPQGGELVVAQDASAGWVEVGLLTPVGWASATAPPYARDAWELFLDNQSDLQFLELETPGLLYLDMASDHGRVWVAGSALDPAFEALVDASINRQASASSTWRLGQSAGLDLWGHLRGSLGGTAAMSTGATTVEGSDMATFVAAATRHPDRVLIVAGDVDPYSAVQLANRVLPPTVPSTADNGRKPLQWPSSDQVLARPELEASWRIWAWPTVDPAAEQAATARVLWHVLLARVEAQLRRHRGWTYGVTSTGAVGPSGDFAGLAVSTRPADAEAAAKLVDAAIAGLAQHPPQADELEQARAALFDALARASSSPGSLALDMALDRMRTGQWQAPQQSLDQAQAVTAEQVVALAHSWLKEGPQANVLLDGSDP